VRQRAIVVIVGLCIAKERIIWVGKRDHDETWRIGTPE